MLTGLLRGNHHSSVFQITCLKMISTKVATNVVRSTTASGSAVYESKRAVDEYLLFHYGKASDQMMYNSGPRSALQFPERCAALCSDFSQEKKRALDVGCAVGGR